MFVGGADALDRHALHDRRRGRIDGDVGIDPHHMLILRHLGLRQHQAFLPGGTALGHALASVERVFEHDDVVAVSGGVFHPILAAELLEPFAIGVPNRQRDNRLVRQFAAVPVALLRADPIENPSNAEAPFMVYLSFEAAHSPTCSKGGPP